MIALMQAVFSLLKKEISHHLLLGALLAIVPMLMTYLSSSLLLHMYTMSFSFSHYVAIICLMLMLAAIQYFYQLKLKNLNLTVLKNFLPQVWSRVLYLKADSLYQYESGVLTQKITNYEQALMALVSAILSITLNIPSLSCLMIYIACCHQYFAMLLSALTAAMLIIKHYYAKHSITISHEIINMHNTIAQFIQESLLQIYKIRSANAEQRIYERWLSKLISAKQQQEIHHYIGLKVSTWEKTIPILLMLSLYLILYAYPERLDPMMLLSFIICLSQYAGLFERLSNDIVIVYQSLPALRAVEELMQAPIDVIDDKKRIIKSLRGDIEFDRVSLCLDGNQYLFQNITFNIKAGEFFGIIGESGAGKSTLLKLLLGLLTPTSGEIRIDGVPLSTFNITSLRQQFGVVMQSSQLLPGTILSNIAMFADITLDEAWQLAEQVGLAHDIEAMPMRMHTYISDSAGESISGGQKQKILLARALATKPRVLILDEATSALDNASQQFIFQTLNAMQITRIMIAHRHSTLFAADKILVLNKGYRGCRDEYSQSAIAPYEYYEGIIRLNSTE